MKIASAVESMLAVQCEVDEVETALEQLSPTASLIRNARFESVIVRHPTRREGWQYETVRNVLSVRSPLPCREREQMSYNITGIDVHKRVLIVVIADAAQPDSPLQ